MPKSIYSISKPLTRYAKEGEIVTLFKIDDRWWIMQKEDGERFSTDRTPFMSDLVKEVPKKIDEPDLPFALKETGRKKTKGDKQNQQSLF